tara:strand:+ start:1346 stop:1807 length:462 start_codon:yes stop_codon:yes gene_type:complete
MAFKMKGGNDPMKKNFGSALNITEKQKEAFKDNPRLLAAIKKSTDKGAAEGNQEAISSATPKLKDNAPMMRMDPSAMKAMGQPAPVKAMGPMKDVDKKAFGKLLKNRSQNNLEKKKELGYDPKLREKMDYNPQSQEGKGKFTKTLTSNIRTKK